MLHIHVCRQLVHEGLTKGAHAIGDFGYTFTAFQLNWQSTGQVLCMCTETYVHALVIMIACQYMRTKVVLRIPLGVRVEYTFRLIITITDLESL